MITMIPAHYIECEVHPLGVKPHIVQLPCSHIEIIGSGNRPVESTAPPIQKRRSRLWIFNGDERIELPVGTKTIRFHDDAGDARVHNVAMHGRDTFVT